MKSTKFIALLLAALLCLPILASCADEAGGTPNTRPPDGSQGENDDFPEADYGNEDFTFLYIKHSDVGKDYYGGNYLDSEALVGLTIEDAVYERNSTVEEKYHVQIKEKVEISGDPAKVLQDFIFSGDYCYDVIYGWCYKLGACITENYFADFMELQDNGTADLTQEYWSPSTVDDLTINGKLYLCMNDISMNKLNWAGMLFFNKQIVEDYNLSEELGGTFYELVDSGKWTLDTYLKSLTLVSTDLDGNGLYTKDDVYGIIEGNNSGAGFAMCCGIESVKKADDGSLVLDMYSEKLLDVISKVNEVYSNSKYVKTYAEMWENGDWSNYNDQWEYARSFFTTDHSLFCGGSAYITSEFRNMNSGYGVLPNPKYDENQESYYSDISVLASIFALPSTVRNDVNSASMERTGTILEYMSYKSNQILLPSFYDDVLKGQRLDTEDDQRMLDVIRGCVRYDLTDAVGIEDVSELLTNMFKRPSAAKSTYDRNARKVQKTLDDFYTKVILLESKGAK